MSILVDIEKQFKGFNLKVQFESGEGVTGLLGASGSGKSMTLRCIAGIEKPDKGRIIVDGVTYFDAEKKINLSPQKRNAGYLFQNYALFPNMTVRQNITAGMKKGTECTQKILQQMLERFQINELENRYPAQLSGGQQQRVALARIFARSPKVLMLDEPFSALDTFLKWELQCEVSKILKDYEGTTLFVSHSRDEVFAICERVAVINDGKIDRFGALRNVFADPISISATKLTGCKNISRIIPLQDHCFEAVDWGCVLCSDVSLSKDITHVGIRAHFFEPTEHPGENTIQIEIENVIESQFKVSVLFKPYGKEVNRPLCWDFERVHFGKESGREFPQYLKISPQNIILMKG